MVRHLLPRAAMNLEKPILAPFWSAAYSFSKCHAEIKVDIEFEWFMKYIFVENMLLVPEMYIWIILDFL